MFCLMESFEGCKVGGLYGWTVLGLEGERNVNGIIFPIRQKQIIYFRQALDLETPKSNQTCPILCPSLLSQLRQ